MKAQVERINAARHFRMESWPRVRHSALKWCMCEMLLRPECRDGGKIANVARRFKVGSAFAFYATKPELYWDGGDA